jgi:hypothetical protein
VFEDVASPRRQTTARNPGVGQERSFRPMSYFDMAFILIVDSQAEFRQQLLRCLEEAGHRATAVGTTIEAAKLVQDDVPDLLATDAVLIAV